jgi:hypothetical protein
MIKVNIDSDDDQYTLFWSIRKYAVACFFCQYYIQYIHILNTKFNYETTSCIYPCNQFDPFL